MMTIAKAYDQLKGPMQKEIALMREILANMHEEELSLLASDKKSWVRTMQIRSDMVVELYFLRKERNLLTQQLEELTRAQLQRKETPLSFDELLPVKETSSSEIRSLLDQIIALIDRMNMQNSRNDALFYQDNSLKLPPSPPSSHPSNRTARRKTTVATYPFPQ